MIITDLDHINSVSEVENIEGAFFERLVATSQLTSTLLDSALNTGVGFSFNMNNVDYLTLGGVGSAADIQQEYLSTSVGTSRISSGKFSLIQFSFG
ncbi:hypothetical protein [Crocosphaera chwakensis]|uniref:Uncharacterized protein n=1 Tax=Crocosphaera chwakensis CCY0110 TaxID=391612 RepID=A3IQI8_9CHRO|nr:hypothetical protein [Crocosphaera chwakensis]EAZ91263.1 hypothetical protein CY0110_11587 [Crocosphaera chwakensis CCY0110]